MKKVLVNYAKFGREDYISAQNRMLSSFIDSGWDGDYFIKSAEPREHRGISIGNDDNIRDHKVVPYAFKPDLIKQAELFGYTKIIWADSTILLLKNLQPLFDHAQKYGVAAFHNVGHDLHRYISDQAAARLGILNLSAFTTIRQIMACCIIFDLGNETGKKIFQEWWDSSYVEGIFQNGDSPRSDFRAHRHDQAALSAILWQHNIPLLPYGDLVYEPHEVTKEYGDPFLVNAGIK